MSRPKFLIYYHGWAMPHDGQRHGNRVNTAVVMRYPENADHIPTEVGLVWGNIEPRRPALVVKWGTALIASFHGASGTGNDDEALIIAVAQRAATMQCSNWYIGADWNREPDQVPIGNGVAHWRSNVPTHPVPYVVNFYDYFICNSLPVQGDVRGIVMSDHYPVLYHFPWPLNVPPGAG